MLAQIRRQGRKCKRPQTSNQRLNHFVLNHLVLKRVQPTDHCKAGVLLAHYILAFLNWCCITAAHPLDKFIQCDNLYIIPRLIYLQIYFLLYVLSMALGRFITLLLSLAASGVSMLHYSLKSEPALENVADCIYETNVLTLIYTNTGPRMTATIAECD